MANYVPMWWMRGNGSRPQARHPEPEAKPDTSPDAAPAAGTLLLLALLWLLYQEKADRKLLLALAYIVL